MLKTTIMRKMLQWATTLLLLICTLSLTAQERILKGKITDEDGAPLANVSVSVKGTSKGAITDISGNFTVKANKGQVLEISLIGYTKQTFTVGDVTAVSFKMKKDNRVLSEVTVTALGIKKEKRGQGFSSQEVKGEEISQTQRENFFNALQGRAAGVTVTSSSGAPGASSQIVLRGFNSLSGNNSPLIIVDGLPVNNGSFNQGRLSTDQPNRNNDYTNRAADINPDDIESVNILKGPEATALYGIEAGSGAIIITTKKGKSGKLKVSYDNSFRLEKAYRFPDVQRVYDNGNNGAIANTRNFFGPKYTPGTQLYDNVKDFFETGFNQKHTLTLEGGVQKTTWRGSITARDQKGVIPNSRYKMYSGRVTMVNKPAKNIDLTTSIAYTYTRNDKAFKGAGGFLQNLLLWPMDDDAKNYLKTDGTRRKVVDDPNFAELDNPYFDVNKNRSYDVNHRLFFNMTASYDATSWLNFTVRGGADVYSMFANYFYHPESQLNRTYGSTAGRVENGTEKYRGYSGIFLTTMKKNIGKFKSTLRVGAANDDYTWMNFSTRGDSLYNKELNDINNTNPKFFATSRETGRDTLTIRRVQGIFGEYNLNFNDIVYLNFTGRNDWTSTLPASSRSFFYPSASIAFVFSDLIAKGSNVLSFGKIRGSYAETAKDVLPYSTQSAYTTQLTSGGGYAYGFTNNNPFIKPERQKTFEVGAELQFFNRRLGFDASYYRTLNLDQIVRLVRLSYATGFVLNTSNIADTKNTGYEVSMNAIPVKTPSFQWRMLVNFTKMQNRVTKLPGNIPEFYNSDTWIGNFRAGITRDGNITQMTGQDYSRNAAGQILIDPTNGFPLVNPDYKKIGDRNPDYTLGITNVFSYKNLSFSFLWDVKVGGDILNANEIWMTNVGLSKRTLDREKPIVYDGVLNDGLQETANPTKNTIPIVPYYNNDIYVSRALAVDYVEHDVYWWRLRDATLNYTFPEKMLRRSKLFSNARVFVTGTDLILITNYTGLDPAVNANSNATLGAGSFGIDYGSLATPRGINFGVNVTFKN